MCLSAGQRRFGRRGMVLILLGSVWLTIGLSIPGAPPVAPRSFLFHEGLPHWARITGWVVTGAAAMVFAPIREPLGRDRWGFTALIVMPVERFASYLVSWVVYLLPGSDMGSHRGWAGAAVWGAVSGLIILCAGWPEPVHRLPSPHGEDAP